MLSPNAMSSAVTGMQPHSFQYRHTPGMRLPMPAQLPPQAQVQGPHATGADVAGIQQAAQKVASTGQEGREGEGPDVLAMARQAWEAKQAGALSAALEAIAGAEAVLGEARGDGSTGPGTTKEAAPAALAPAGPWHPEISLAIDPARPFWEQTEKTAFWGAAGKMGLSALSKGKSLLGKAPAAAQQVKGFGQGLAGRAPKMPTPNAAAGPLQAGQQAGSRLAAQAKALPGKARAAVRPQPQVSPNGAMLNGPSQLQQGVANAWRGAQPALSKGMGMARGAAPVAGHAAMGGFNANQASNGNGWATAGGALLGGLSRGRNTRGYLGGYARNVRNMNRAGFTGGMLGEGADAAAGLAGYDTNFGRLGTVAGMGLGAMNPSALGGLAGKGQSAMHLAGQGVGAGIAAPFRAMGNAGAKGLNKLTGMNLAKGPGAAFGQAPAKMTPGLGQAAHNLGIGAGVASMGAPLAAGAMDYGQNMAQGAFDTVNQNAVSAAHDGAFDAVNQKIDGFLGAEGAGGKLNGMMDSVLGNFIGGEQLAGMNPMHKAAILMSALGLGGGMMTGNGTMQGLGGIGLLASVLPMLMQGQGGGQQAGPQGAGNMLSTNPNIPQARNELAAQQDPSLLGEEPVKMGSDERLRRLYVRTGKLPHTDPNHPCYEQANAGPGTPRGKQAGTVIATKEDCDECGASMEMGDDHSCNRCGAKDSYGQKEAADVSDDYLRGVRDYVLGTGLAHGLRDDDIAINQVTGRVQKWAQAIRDMDDDQFEQMGREYADAMCKAAADHWDSITDNEKQANVMNGVKSLLGRVQGLKLKPEGRTLRQWWDGWQDANTKVLNPDLWQTGRGQTATAGLMGASGAAGAGLANMFNGSDAGQALAQKSPLNLQSGPLAPGGSGVDYVRSLLDRYSPPELSTKQAGLGGMAMKGLAGLKGKATGAMGAAGQAAKNFAKKPGVNFAAGLGAAGAGAAAAGPIGEGLNLARKAVGGWLVGPELDRQAERIRQVARANANASAAMRYGGQAQSSGNSGLLLGLLGGAGAGIIGSQLMNRGKDEERQQPQPGQQLLPA